MVEMDVNTVPYGLRMGKIEFRGMTAYVIESRVDPEAFDAVLKAGWFMYGIRGSDEDFGEPSEIAFGVVVNFWGVIITEHPLPLKVKGNLKLTVDESESIANAVNFQEPQISIKDVFKAKE